MRHANHVSDEADETAIAQKAAWTRAAWAVLTVNVVLAAVLASTVWHRQGVTYVVDVAPSGPIRSVGTLPPDFDLKPKEIIKHE